MDIKHQEGLDTFFYNLNEKLNVAKKERENQNITESLDFNIFNQFFRLGENKTSQILAFFLDPNEAHGQGNFFLKSFIESLNNLEGSMNPTIPLDILEKDILITIEEPTKERRRIDIYIKFGDNDFIIAIENKIWAEDQPNQLFDYNQHLKFKTEKSVLIYLTPYGKNASESSISSKNGKNSIGLSDYVILDYRIHLIELIRNEWMVTCKSDRINFLLHDFMQYFEQEINNKSIMSNYSNEIANHIIDNKELGSAFKVHAALPEIKKQLVHNLLENLRLLGFICDKKFGLKDKQVIFSLKNNLFIRILFLKDYNTMVLGVHYDKERIDDKVYEDKLIKKLNELNIGENLKNDKGWGDWVWITRPLNFDSQWKDSTPWLNGSQPFLELVENIKTELEKIS